ATQTRPQAPPKPTPRPLRQPRPPATGRHRRSATRLPTPSPDPAPASPARPRRRKRGLDSTLPVLWQQPAPRHCFSAGLILLFRRLLWRAAFPRRGSAAVLDLCDSELALGLPRLPHWSSGRLWLLRLGYFQLHRPKQHADDWVWIIDHSQQAGTAKCLL